MLIVRRLQRRNGIFNQRRVSLAKLALPYAIESVAFSDKNQSTICLFQIMSIVFNDHFLRSEVTYLSKFGFTETL